LTIHTEELCGYAFGALINTARRVKTTIDADCFIAKPLYIEASFRPPSLNSLLMKNRHVNIILPIAAKTVRRFSKATGMGNRTENPAS
jgi:hypothetical protein